MQQISVRQLADWLADSERPHPLLLDVREPGEHQVCQIAGSQLMPMGSVPLRLGELDAAAPTVCICHLGGRSMQVAMFLERNGFQNIFNLAGGVDAWAGEIDPSMHRY
jgi:rhodanese-related sulfurtransferase